jgi:hypothetical protein
MKKRVLIFDDDQGVRQGWKERLDRIPSFTANFTAEVRAEREFRDALAGLEGRQRVARKRDIDWDDVDLLDEIDILFVDYDLLTLYEDKFEVGESVAYLARCYSKCGLIVALNQFGRNPFDLTLRGHPESFADLNLGSHQIDNVALWETPRRTRTSDFFRPWYWPCLPMALSSFYCRRDLFLENPTILDGEILSYFGLREVLPRNAVEFIQGKGAPEATTFRDFVADSGRGLHEKDEGDDHVFAQVAAARVAKWLERLVLAGQSVLVDAPHLVTRFPGLLDSEGIQDVEAWNRTTELFHPELEKDTIAGFEFPGKDWLSRVAWFGNRLADSGLQDRLDPWGLELPGFVFCEDRSAFRKRHDAREFVSEVPSAHVRRFVGSPTIEGVQYQPSVRFAL